MGRKNKKAALESDFLSIMGMETQAGEKMDSSVLIFMPWKAKTLAFSAFP